MTPSQCAHRHCLLQILHWLCRLRIHDNSQKIQHYLLPTDYLSADQMVEMKLYPHHLVAETKAKEVSTTEANAIVNAGGAPSFVVSKIPPWQHMTSIVSPSQLPPL